MVDQTMNAQNSCTNFNFTMNRIVLRRLSSGVKGLHVQARKFSDVAHHHDRTSVTPLIEHYRSSWPDFAPDRPVATVAAIPERTVSDDVLRFTYTAHFSTGSDFFHPHLTTNPAGFKVILKFFLHDLPLNDEERQIFVRMVGPRIKVGNGEVKLTCNKFPNKLENRKYLLFQLESLLKEAKRLLTIKDQHLD